MTDQLNEVAAAAKDAKRVRDAAEESGRPAPSAGAKWPLVPIGIGVGIGSAAVAAAMLYARGERKKR